MVTVVNAVGGGNLQREIDLKVLCNDLEAYSCKFNPDYPWRIYLKLEEESPTIALFRTGKYSIAGAGSVSDLLNENERFKNEMEKLGIIERNHVTFDVRYLVGIGDLGYQLDLSEVHAMIGPEAEYEPEQFPGLHCEFSNTSYVVFSTGKISINGPRTKEKLEERFTYMDEKLSDVGSNTND